MHAVSNARDNASNDQLSQRERGALNSCSNDHNDRPDPNNRSSSKAITEPQAADGANEASNLVETDGHTLEGRGVRGSVLSGGVNRGESVREGGEGQETSHDSLVVTEEELCARDRGGIPVSLVIALMLCPASRAYSRNQLQRRIQSCGSREYQRDQRRSGTHRHQLYRTPSC